MNTRRQTVPPNDHALFFGSIDDKLRLGERLFATHGENFTNDPPLRHLFADLQERQRQLASLMEKMALGSLCCTCAAEAGGGCCSMEMAGEIDAVQVFLNLLAGVEVVRYENGAECCFLGPKGCIFLFKPMFCLNYNCRRISTHLDVQGDGAQMERLLTASGRLLGKQCEMELLFLAAIGRPPDTP